MKGRKCLMFPEREETSSWKSGKGNENWKGKIK